MELQPASPRFAARHAAFVLAISLLAAGTSPVAALAADTSLSLDGTPYDGTYNEHGMVLAPASGSAGVIYLGLGCDVFSPSLGNGRWSTRGPRVYVEFTNGTTLPFDGTLRPTMAQLCPL
ncbi:MAG: hypothetical protein AAGJ96_05435 [Pseudomonadota bacterium]